MGAGTGRGEFEFRSPDGRPLPVYLAFSSMPSDDVATLCLAVTDLTEQKERQGLREANRRKDEFLAMLAHELRNPLAPIRNALYLLKRGDVDSTSSEDVRSMMERQVEHLARLIDDLMDVSRITSGKVEMRMEVVDLAAAVSKAIEVSRPLMDQKGHALTIGLPFDPIFLDADPTRLGQVLDNLLTNAAKYTDPGGVNALSARHEGEDVVIRLLDDGIGIDPEKLPGIFGLFVQAERRLDRSQGGLGLGLSLVKSLIELYGDAVTAYSDGLGLGSEFVVRLPARAADATDEPTPGPVSTPKSPEAALPKRRILVVDDNEDTARSMSMLLRRLWGQETEVAHDGEEAITKAEWYRPDVILIDIGLPGMSGFEVAERLRGRPWTTRPLIVAMTGLGQEEDLRPSEEAGFDHLLVKPVDLEALRGLIAALSNR